MTNRFLPNIGDVAANRKELAWPDALHFDALIAAKALNGVLDGCALSADGGGPLRVGVAVGCVVIDGVAKTVAAQTVDLTTGSGMGSGLARLDLITINTSGVVAVEAGVAAAVPVYKAIPASQVVLGGVLIIDGQTTVVDGDINDMGIDLSRQPFYMNRSTATVTINNSAAEATLASFTIPGRSLGSDGGVRMRFGGQVLVTTGDPTITWRIKLGGVQVMRSGDVSPFTTSSNVREYVAEIGFINVSATSQRWYGTTWIGDAFVQEFDFFLPSVGETLAALGYEESLEDTDDDKLLDVTHQWGTANVNISINRKWLTVERIPPS